MPKKAPTLHYRSYGHGTPVVFLHGFLASSAYWKKVTALIARNHRVIAIDLLGFGNSPKPRRSKYDYDAHIASIDQTLRSAGVTGPFILVGHSMGALLSLRYANIHKTRVQKLVLTNMPIMLGRQQVIDNILKTNIVFRLGLTPFTHRIMWGTAKLLYRSKLLPAGAFGELNTHIEYVFKHSPMSRLKSFRRVIMQAKTDVDLKMIGVKTTLLSGIEDRKVYLDNLTHHIGLSPYVSVRNFNTGHHIPLVMPEVIAETILATK